MTVQDVIMDHALQTISYIADIGDLLVIMVRLAVKPVTSPSVMSVSNGAAVSAETEQRRKRVTICCHIFESDEVSLIKNIFLDPEGGSLKATVVVVVLLVISSLKIPKAFLIRSRAHRNFAYTFALTFPTDLPSQIFVCPMQSAALDRI